MQAPKMIHAPIRGAVLVEALVALVVLAFGMLALSRLQLALSQSTQVARERTEAALHAQAKLEELRGFQRLNPAPGERSWQELTDGEDEPQAPGPAAYARSWTVSDSATAALRVATVRVSWTGRDDATETVTLRSIIARADPADNGRLGMPERGDLWRPKGRARTVPWDAITLRGANKGRSVSAWTGPSAGFLVFDDATGLVIAHCATRPADGTDIAGRCTAMAGHLVQGYVSGPAGEGPLSIVFDRLQHLHAGSEPECSVFDLGEDVKRYRCLIQPGDHDDDASTPPVWSGRALVSGVAPGTTVCRYTPDAQTTRNADHPDTYTLVGEPLDHQNFALVSAGDCPSGSVPHPAA